jgi:hypothetical protein
MLDNVQGSQSAGMPVVCPSVLCRDVLEPDIAGNARYLAGWVAWG